MNLVAYRESGCRSLVDLASMDLVAVDLTAVSWSTVDLIAVGLALWMGLAFWFQLS